MAVGGEHVMVDADCPLCQMLGEGVPMFWHLDGCNMDEEFPFEIFCATREEWEEQERRRKEWDAEGERQQQARAAGNDDEPLWPEDAAPGDSANVWDRALAGCDEDELAEVTLFGIGACLAELIVDLKQAKDSRHWIDLLNRDFGNLRDAVANPAGWLVSPVVTTFSDNLTALAEAHADLHAKCTDLERQLNDFVHRLDPDPTMDDDMPF